MPLPGGATGFTLTGGPYDDPAFEGMVGKLTTNVPVTHLATGERLRTSWTVTIDYSGNFTVGPLPFSDDPAFTPNGFTYTMQWQALSYKPTPGNLTFAVPQSAGTTVDFDTLAPAAPGQIVLPTTVFSVVGQTGAVTGTQIAADPALRAAYVPKWKANTAYASGEPVLNPSGQVVTANAAFTSGSTYSAANWTVVSGGGGAVASVNGKTGTVVLSATDVGADASGAASSAQAASLQKSANLSDLASATTARTNLGLGTAATQPTSAFDAAGAAAAVPLTVPYGQVAGVANKPISPAPTRSGNLWSLANLYQGATLGPNTTALNKSSLTPSVTMNGISTRLTSRVQLPGNANVVYKYRLTVTVTLTGTLAGGSPTVTVGFRDISSAQLGTDQTILGFNNNADVMPAWTSTFEVDGSQLSTSPSYLDVSLYAPNNDSGGATLALSNVTLRQIERVTPLIRCGWDRAPAVGANFLVQQPVGVTTDGSTLYAERSFGPDSSAPCVPNGSRAFPYNALQTPAKVTSVNFGQEGPQKTFYTNNNEQIISAQRTDSAYELRGNTHGGEVGASGVFGTDAQAFADYGDGVWQAITDYPWAHYCYRVKVVIHTKMTRSDQSSPFLLVDTTYVLYADGTMREDRVNTWQQDQVIDHHFYMMTSFNPAANSTSRFRARIGRGRQILGDLNFAEVIPPPVMNQTATIATTGGTIGAPPSGDYFSVFVTSLSPYGESVASAMQPLVATTGTTNTVTVSWTAPTTTSGTAPSGYNVYFGIRGAERFVGTVAAGTTTYTITAPPAGSAARPPLVNTAITGFLNGTLAAEGPFADYATVYDPWTTVAFATAVDRSNVATLTGVNGIRATIQNSGGVMKSYWHMSYAGPSGGLPYTVPSGTVQSSTLWWFAYQPGDREQFHRELEVPTSQLSALAALYPTT